MKRFLIIGFMAIPALVYGAGHGHGAHQHGVATLDVVVEGNTLQLELSSPADNLLGFEHAPKTAAERAKVDQLVKNLAQAELLFNPEPAAACQPAPAAVAAPAWGKSGHSDVDADYRYSCKRAPATIALPIWQRYPGIRQLIVNIATDQGQRQLTLQPGQAISLR